MDYAKEIARAACDMADATRYGDEWDAERVAYLCECDLPAWAYAAARRIMRQLLSRQAQHTGNAGRSGLWPVSVPFALAAGARR